MAQEVIKFAVEATPLITAAGSFAAGRVMLAYAQRNENTDRVSPSERLQSVNEESLDQNSGEVTNPLTIRESSLSEAMLTATGRQPSTQKTAVTAETPSTKRKPSREGFMGRIVLRSLPFMCAAAGYVAADAINNERDPVGAEPKVVIVADRSGATEYGTDTKDDTSPANRITEALKAFNAKEEAFGAVALVAGSGQVEEYTLEESLTERNLEASGDAPMRGAFTQAINRARVAKLNDEPGRESAAVVVLTNGNNFASETAIKRAKESAVPIYVVDTSDKTPKDNAFSEISRGSNGVYWDKGTDPNQVVDKVTSKLEPVATEEGLDMNLLPPFLLFGGGLLLALREAKLKPLTFGGLNKIMNKRSK